MALFKSRKESPDATGAAADSVETIRRRARHRLIGATILVLAGVIGFPLVFETQPRPVPVDIPIHIPDRNKARTVPVTQPEARLPVAEPAAASVPEPAASAPRPPVNDGLAPKEELVTAPRADAAKAETPRAAASAANAPAGPAADDGARARALLDGKTDPSKDPAAEPLAARFVVQVGAYAEADKARDVRQQLERAGLKTYTHIAETRDGKRIRVRVGPFPSKAEADRVAQKVKSLGLPVAVLSL